MINYPWLSLQFIRSSNYNKFYNLICLKWEQVIQPYLTKHKTPYLSLAGFYEYTKTLRIYSNLVPLKQLAMLYKTALVLYINEFYDEDCRLQKENSDPNFKLKDDAWDASTIANDQPRKFNKQNLHAKLGEDTSKLEHVRFELDFLGRKNLIFMLSGELVPSTINREDTQM